LPELVLSNFAYWIAQTLGGLLWVYQVIIIISALLSWVSPDPYNPIVRFLRAVTEPVLHQVRRRMPFVYAAGIDFSPLVVIAAIQLAQWVVVQSLFDLARQLRNG
jgi:YggT family protein